MSDQETVDDIVDNVKEDSFDVDIDVVVDDNMPLLFTNMNTSSLISKYCVCVDDDEPWEVRANSSSSNKCDADLPTCSNVFQADNPKIQGMERKILVPNKKLKNSNFETSGDKKLKKLKLEKQSGSLQTATKRKCFLHDGAVGMDFHKKFSQINLEDNCDMNRIFVSKERLEVNVKFGESSEESRLNANQGNGQDFNETNRTLSDLPDSTCSTHLPDPSCSTDLAGLSNSTGKLHLASDFPESKVDEELVTQALLNICNESYLNDSWKPMTTPIGNVGWKQDVSTVPIEKCHFLEGVSANLKCSSGNGSHCRVENPRCFVEDDDIVNPDILYNIDLNEHYNKMNILVEKIVTATDDDQTQSVLNECLQLMPIPRVEHERKTFTAKERSNYLHGIREYEYEIDSDDWNKIMVKRAAIFTAHAGFSIANEESLYVLADVAIEYIKKLAVIMKKNFDIQLNSSYPDLVDPIANSLQEIGVHGGVDELIEHYENDVYGRRDELTEGCERLQAIVDQYVERAGNPAGEPGGPTPHAVGRGEPRREGDAAAAAGVRAEAGDGGTRRLDLLKPFTGYVAQDPKSTRADHGINRRPPSASWKRRNANVFDIRDYMRPYDIRTLDRPRSSAGGNRSGGGGGGGGRGAATVARPRPAAARDRRAAELRDTLINDLEKCFERFMSGRARDGGDVPSAGRDGRTSPDEQTAAGTVSARFHHVPDDDDDDDTLE